MGNWKYNSRAKSRLRLYFPLDNKIFVANHERTSIDWVGGTTFYLVLAIAVSLYFKYSAPLFVINYS